jgi:hypothetical protein
VRGRKTTEKGAYPFVAGWVKMVGWAAGMEGRGRMVGSGWNKDGPEEERGPGKGRGFLFSFIFKIVLQIDFKPLK